MKSESNTIHTVPGRKRLRTSMIAALLCIVFAAVFAASCSVFGQNSLSKKLPKITKSNFGAYLLVYFREHNHDVFFAMSKDGYTFTDVNGGKCVMKGIDLAEQKGIRDPHIYRGPDGFYLALTDLHIYAKQEGLRDTEWQRDGGKYGWGNNLSIVLMKSQDLINWTRTDYNILKAFPELGDISCAWAPQTLFDPAEGKMMVYLTIGRPGKHSQIYYAYTDKDFTKFVTAPKLLGFDPPMDHTYIDADISKVGDTYHIFTSDGGIKHGESKFLTHGYRYVNNENCAKVGGGVEAPTVWRRFGTDKYVLMYDNFSQPNEMAFSETTDFRNFKNLGRFNQGEMKAANFNGAKHGAVIYLTKDEAAKLAKQWNLKSY